MKILNKLPEYFVVDTKFIPGDCKIVAEYIRKKYKYKFYLCKWRYMGKGRIIDSDNNTYKFNGSDDISKVPEFENIPIIDINTFKSLIKFKSSQNP